MTLPWNDMTGFTGWLQYLLAAVLMLSVAIGVGYKAGRFWIGTFHIRALARRQGRRAPRASLWEWLIGGTLIVLPAIFILMFIKLIILPIVEVVRFNDQAVTLVYRWKWLNKTIPYDTVKKVELADDISPLKLFGGRPRGGYPLKVVITTDAHTFEVNRGSNRWRGKAEDIYHELNRHASDFEK